MDIRISYSNEHAVLKLYKLGSIFALMLTLIMSIIAFSSVITSGGRYFANTPMVIVSILGIFINISFALTSFFAFKSKETCVTMDMKKLKYMGFVPALSSVLPIYVALRNIMPSFDETQSLAKPPITSFIIIILALASVVYFLSFALPMSKSTTLLSGYANIFLLTLIIVELYTDFSVEMNAPIKLGLQFSAAAAMLSVRTDLKMIVSKSHIGMIIFAKLSLATLSLFTLIGVLSDLFYGSNQYEEKYYLYAFYISLCSVFAMIQLFSTVLLDARKEEIPSQDNSEISAANKDNSGEQITN